MLAIHTTAAAPAACGDLGGHMYLMICACRWTSLPPRNYGATTILLNDDELPSCKYAWHVPPTIASHRCRHLLAPHGHAWDSAWANGSNKRKNGRTCVCVSAGCARADDVITQQQSPRSVYKYVTCVGGCGAKPSNQYYSSVRGLGLGF